MICSSYIIFDHLIFHFRFICNFFTSQISNVRECRHLYTRCLIRFYLSRLSIDVIKSFLWLFVLQIFFKKCIRTIRNLQRFQIFVSNFHCFVTWSSVQISLQFHNTNFSITSFFVCFRRARSQNDFFAFSTTNIN